MIKDDLASDRLKSEKKKIYIYILELSLNALLMALTQTNFNGVNFLSRD